MSLIRQFIPSFFSDYLSFHSNASSRYLYVFQSLVLLAHSTVLQWECYLGLLKGHTYIYSQVLLESRTPSPGFCRPIESTGTLVVAILPLSSIASGWG